MHVKVHVRCCYAGLLPYLLRQPNRLLFTLTRAALLCRSLASTLLTCILWLHLLIGECLGLVSGLTLGPATGKPDLRVSGTLMNKRS